MGTPVTELETYHPLDFKIVTKDDFEGFCWDDFISFLMMLNGIAQTSDLDGSLLVFAFVGVFTNNSDGRLLVKTPIKAEIRFW